MLKGLGISRMYSARQRVLSGVDVEVSQGSITALLGANGCGKSTLLRALALIEPIDAGVVEVDGHRYRYAKRVTGPPPWPAVTMVFQQLFLWPHLTVRRNITLPQEQLGGAGAAETFNDVVRMFDLTKLLDRYPNEISLGQRQRVALARALAVRPRYLLLDEVTSALDIEHVTTLLGYLRTLREAGIGILLVTHLIGFARHTSDRILFMSGGRITEEGGPEILSAPATPELSRFLTVLESSDAFSGRQAVVRA